MVVAPGKARPRKSRAPDAADLRARREKLAAEIRETATETAIERMLVEVVEAELSNPEFQKTLGLAL